MKHTQQFVACTQRPRRRRSNPPGGPARVQFAHAGGGVWAALIVDRHGVGLEFITGSRAAVLLAIRTRWPGVPVDHLAFAVEDQGANGHRVNPGVPSRVELAHAGAGQWVAIVLDDRGVALEIISGGKQVVLDTLRERWPDLPLRRVPFITETENPAGVPHHAQITYSGLGQHVAFILDADGRELERFQGSLSEVQAWLRQHYPRLPVRFLPRRNPAAGKAGPKKGAVSDRALRYRAAATPPPGPRTCMFCGATRHVEVGHIDGHEEHGGPDNLCWVCRSCNTKMGVVFKRLGLGRRTHQFNPAVEGAASLGAWLSAVLSVRGESNVMSVPAAIALIRATPPEDRSGFAAEIWRKRRSHFGPSGRPAAVPF